MPKTTESDNEHYPSSTTSGVKYIFGQLRIKGQDILQMYIAKQLYLSFRGNYIHFTRKVTHFLIPLIAHLV